MNSIEILFIKLLEEILDIDGLEENFLSSRKYMLEAVTFNAANGDKKYRGKVQPGLFLSENENRDFLIIQEIQPDFEKYFQHLPDNGKNYELITGFRSGWMGIVYNKEKFEPSGDLQTASIKVSGSRRGTHGAIIQVFSEKKSNKKIKIINIHAGHNHQDNVKKEVIQKIVNLQKFGDSDIMITAGDFNSLSSDKRKLIEGVIGDGFNDETETHSSGGILDQIGIKTKEKVKKNVDFKVLSDYGSDHKAVLLEVELN